MKIGVVGAGNVGGTLGRGWVKRGHEVRFGVRDPASTKVRPLLDESRSFSAGTVADAARFGEVVVLTTPWPETRVAIQAAGDLGGKIVLDATNPIAGDFSWLEIGHTTSGGEQVAGWAPGARVVKIFNTVGSNVMADPRFGDRAAAMLHCGDDADAKRVAGRLAADLGFEPVDAGPLVQARLLEGMAWLWITMALKHGYGRDMAFTLLRR